MLFWFIHYNGIRKTKQQAEFLVLKHFLVPHNSLGAPYCHHSFHVNHPQNIGQYSLSNICINVEKDDLLPDRSLSPCCNSFTLCAIDRALMWTFSAKTLKKKLRHISTNGNNWIHWILKLWFKNLSVLSIHRNCKSVKACNTSTISIIPTH